MQISRSPASHSYDSRRSPGSLISIRRNVEGIVILSEETALRLNPMNFEEFLWASGEEPLAALIRDACDSKKPLPTRCIERPSGCFASTCSPWGMPQAVEAYLTEKDLGRVDRVKRDILALYSEDVEKFKDKFKARVGTRYILHPKPMSVEGDLVRLPLYMAHLL